MCVCVIEGRRRVTLHEEMSASDSSRGRVLAGLTLDDVLANQKRPSSTPPREPPSKNRTLLDIIKEDETNKKDRRFTFFFLSCLIFFRFEIFLNLGIIKNYNYLFLISVSFTIFFKIFWRNLFMLCFITGKMLNL